MLNSIVKLSPFWSKRNVRIGVIFLALAVIPYHASAEEYLSTEEVGAIGTFSLSTLYLGSRARKIDSGKSSLIVNPFPLENTIQSWLGGKYYPGKSNFLDSRLGSAITSVGAGFVLTLANISYPRGATSKDVGQDIFLFTSGLLVTKGLTSLAKGLVARPRPYVRNDLNFESMRYTGKFRYKNASFFSGHTSSAFFAVTFLNLRLRDVMRRKMSGSKYHDWRWAPPVLLFSWASMVGWSRIHSYRHYLSDVAVGAVAGWLLAELFYSFSEELKNNDPIGQRAAPTLFRISIPI